MQNAYMAHSLWQNQEARSITLKAHLQICRLSCHKGPYITPKHHQKMFGVSLKFTKKTGWRPRSIGELTTHPRISSRIEPLGASTQGRTLSNAKCVTEILGGDKIKKLEDKV